AMHVPDLVGRKLAAALDALRAGELGVERPMQRVVMMRAPAGDHPEAIGFVAQPARSLVIAVLRMYALLGVVRERRGAEPFVIVEVRRDRLHRIVGLRRVDWQSDLDATHASNASRAHQLARATKLRARSLLAADLHDAPRARNCIAQED